MKIEIHLILKSFKKLSRGLTKLADESASFKSKTIMGLLRGAPDLIAHVKQIEDLFQKPNTGEKSRSCTVYVTVPFDLEQFRFGRTLASKRTRHGIRQDHGRNCRSRGTTAKSA